MEQYGYITTYLSSLLLMYIGGVSCVLLLWIKLLWTSLLWIKLHVHNHLVNMCSFLLGKYQGMKLPGHWVSLCSVLVTTGQHSSKWSYKFTLLPPEYESSSYSMSSPTLCIVSLFNFSHSGGYEVISRCSFNLHFPDE